MYYFIIIKGIWYMNDIGDENTTFNRKIDTTLWDFELLHAWFFGIMKLILCNGKKCHWHIVLCKPHVLAS